MLLEIVVIIFCLINFFALDHEDTKISQKHYHYAKLLHVAERRIQDQNIVDKLINSQKVRVMRQICWLVILKSLEFQSLDTHSAY